MKKSNMGNITQKWVDLLIPFLENYSAKFSVSELSRKSKIPQQTVSRYLNKLVKLNLVSYIKDGKNKLFHLDITEQKTKIILDILENQKALEFQLRNEKVAVVINELLRYCESLIIFGSYASENFHHESDLDLVILGKSNKKELKKIINKQIMEINEHYINYEEFEKILKERNPLAIEILGNHILFGNVSKIREIFWRREYERR